MQFLRNETLVYLQHDNKRRKKVQRRKQNILVCLTKSLLIKKQRARDKKIKVWMYKQICSSMTGVTSCATLAGDCRNSEANPNC